MRTDPRRIFVVHGRNEAAREAMFAFLRSLGLAPLEWEQAVRHTGSGAPHLGEILRQALAGVQAVVVLLSGDDEARLRQHLRAPDDSEYERELRPQPRANVLFESGMAFATHGERTILVQLGEIRPFSDIAGRHVIRFDGSPEDRRVLASRLATVGCAVDLSGEDWLRAGDFGTALALTRASERGAPEPAGSAPARDRVRVHVRASFVSLGDGALQRLLVVEIENPASAPFAYHSLVFELEDGGLLLPAEDAAGEAVARETSVPSGGTHVLAFELAELLARAGTGRLLRVRVRDRAGREHSSADGELRAALAALDRLPAPR